MSRGFFCLFILILLNIRDHLNGYKKSSPFMSRNIFFVNNELLSVATPETVQQVKGINHYQYS